MGASILKFFNNLPFLRYLLFFVLGVLAYVLKINVYYVLCLLIPLIAVFYLSRNTIYKIPLLLALGHYVLLIAGYVLCLTRDDTQSDCFILKQKNTNAYKAVVNTVLSENRFVVKCLAGHDTVWKQTVGNCVLTLKENKKYKINDTLFIAGTPQRVTVPLNPEEFNHVLYFKSKDIYTQHFVNSSQILGYKPSTQFSILNGANQLRDYFSKQIRKYITDADNAAISEALILGVKSQISSELLQAYSHTGTIHVLAVSGMHVGVLFGSIVWLLSRIFGSRFPWLSAVLALLVMWMFALVTGFSASVVRASVMYSVYQIGVLLGKKVNLPNTLFSSAFIMVLVQPFMIMDVGFQLSFFAVLGIVVIQPIFQKMWFTMNRFKVFIRDLFTVTISAQLGVLPITLFYFHQFPNLFIISNLFEVLLSTIALYVGLIALLISSFDFVASFIFQILEYLIEAMNFIAKSLASLPYAVSALYIDVFEMILMSCLIIAFIILLKTKRKMYFNLFLGCMVLYCLKLFYTNYVRSSTSKLLFYANYKEQVIDVYDKGNTYRFLVNNDSVKNVKFSTTLHVNNLKNGFNTPITSYRLNKEKNLTIVINSTQIEILNNNNYSISPKTKYVYFSPKVFPTKTPTKCLVVVPNVWQKKYLLQLGCTNIYCLQEQGALEL